MNELFLKIINMSISASWLVLVVLLLRLVLRKAPKWVHVLLWGIVGFRLIFPFSVESPFSLIPNAETIPMNIEMNRSPAIDSGITAINSLINPVISSSFTPHPTASANPLQIWIPLASILWIVGMVVMLLYTAISYWYLRRKVAAAVLYRDNIFQSEKVISPFVLGIIKPKIYLPFKLDEQNLEHVVAHEQAHIRRKDHWWKPLGFLILTIHWFNPLIWLANVLLCRDIELACDEKVIKELDNEQRADYTQALVNCSMNRRIITVCPLAFGEVGVKERVESIMNYKKPAFWIIALSIVICFIIAICFLTNPRQDRFSLRIVIPAGSQDQIVYADEEISPLGNHITITCGDGLGDTEVFLKPVQPNFGTAYDTPTYLTPGLTEKIEAEKGAWFKIGVNMQNNTDEDIVVYLNVENVEVRIFNDIEQYRTDYIGDASKTSHIAQLLPYPKDYTYSSIELQTSTEPYELIVYLNGNETVQPQDFETCSITAFNLIGNMGIISFRDAESETMLASFTRTDYEADMKFYLTIGAEDVTYIEFSMPHSSGGCQHADGSPFQKGEQIWLENLDGYSDLCGLIITALNGDGKIVWSASIPDEEENKGITHLTQDDWIITNIE